LTKLAHQLLPDDRVFVSAVGRSMSCHISAAEARRFAWALLADLDPAEADFLGYSPPTLTLSNGRLREREWRPGPWQRIAVLQAIVDGKDVAPRIGDYIGTTRGQASVQLCKLLKLGLVEKLSIGRSYYPGKWGLTDTGHAFLAEFGELGEAA
jgi:hypothetical protein